MRHRPYIALGLAAELWASAAWAECFRIGDAITCIDTSRGSIITTDSVRVTVNGNLVNIPSPEVFGFCPVSPPTISVGEQSTVTNNGSIIGFGLCGTAVATGRNSTIVSSGSITTTGAVANAIDAAENSVIRVSGGILTGGNLSYAIVARDGAKITLDRTATVATVGLAANGIYAEANPTIVNDGSIRTSGFAAQGIEVFGFSLLANAPIGQASITNNGLIDVTGERATAVRVDADVLNFANTGVLSALFSASTRFTDLSRGLEVTAGEATITNTGVIRGAGSGVFGNLTRTVAIANSGTIAALSPVGRAIEVTAPKASLTNTGTISGGVIGLRLAGEADVSNDGTIEVTSALTPGATPVALTVRSNTNVRADIFNQGVIAARLGGLAIEGSNGRDQIFNRGRIVGDVDLGGGDDLFQLFNNASVLGRIRGGAGDDRINVLGQGTAEFTAEDVESIVVLTDGPWTVRSDIAVRDFAAILSGELALAGSGRLRAGRVSVSTGAVLSGNGGISGTVTAAGTIAPGPGLARLSVDGDLILDTTASLRLDVGEGRASDQLAVSGAVRLGGSLALTSLRSGAFRGGESFDVITAERGVSGTFTRIDGLTTAFLKTSVVVSADSRTASIRIDRAPYTSAARTPNQAAVAGALDRALGRDSNGLQGTFRALDALAAAEASTALDRVAPTLPHAAASAGEIAAQMFQDSIGQKRQATPMDQRYRVWGLASRREGGPIREQGTGYAYRAWGKTAGIDAALGERVRAGLAIGHVDLDLNLRAQPARADTTQTNVAAYARGTWTTLETSGGVYFGDGAADLWRPAGLTATTTTQTRSDSDAWGGFISASTPITADWLVIEPAVGAQYGHTALKGYRETGQLALQFSRQSRESLRLSAQTSVTAPSGKVRPMLLLKASRELLSRRKAVQAAFVDDPMAQFALTGVTPRTLWVEGQFGIEADVTDAVSLRLGVEGNLTDSIGGRSLVAGASLRW